MLKLVSLVLYCVIAQAVIYTLTDGFLTAMLYSLLAGLVAAGVGWGWRRRSAAQPSSTAG